MKGYSICSFTQCAVYILLVLGWFRLSGIFFFEAADARFFTICYQ